MLSRLSKVRDSWFLEATDFCHPQALQIHRCIFAPVTSVNAHYYSVLTTPFDMVNAHYVIIDFRAKFFIKIQNQASDTSRSLPSFSSAPFLLRAVPIASDLGKSKCCPGEPRNQNPQKHTPRPAIRFWRSFLSLFCPSKVKDLATSLPCMETSACMSG